MKVLLLYGAQLDVQNQVRPASLHPGGWGRSTERRGLTQQPVPRLWRPQCSWPETGSGPSGRLCRLTWGIPAVGADDSRPAAPPQPPFHPVLLPPSHLSVALTSVLIAQASGAAITAAISADGAAAPSRAAGRCSSSLASSPARSCALLERLEQNPGGSRQGTAETGVWDGEAEEA